MRNHLILISILLCCLSTASAQQKGKPKEPPPAASPGVAQTSQSSAASPAPKEAPPVIIKLPAQTSALSQDFDEQIAEVKRQAELQTELLTLKRANAVLLGCLEVGCTKAQLESGHFDLQAGALVLIVPAPAQKRVNEPAHP